jgi:hypothetical protein
MDVRLIEKKGCAWIAASVFSLGLAPLLANRHARQSPVRLTEEEMVLRNGTRIPWDQFSGVTATKVYLNKRYIRTRYVLKHTRGKVMVENDGMYDADRVIEFVLAHVPPQALQG